ncbi:MAG: hypothetical protein WKF85_06900 [Chitinophagaceae bacterium]
MKKLLLIPLVILFVSTGCKKDPVINSAPPTVLPSPPILPLPPQPVSPVNTGPKASAGFDKWVPLPANFFVVYGGTSHAASTIESYLWKKISGPASYQVENPGSKQTKVTNLEKGTYEFEFTVTTKAGLSDKDTISIHVYEPRTVGANEFIFKYLEWICPLDCYVLIENFNLYVPNGTAFKVFLKSANSVKWIDISNRNGGDKYFFEIINNNFYIHSYYPDDEVEVKITF